MAASEHTTNLALPIFKVNDRVSITDFNTAMEDIDSAYTGLESKVDSVSGTFCLKWVGTTTEGDSIFQMEKEAVTDG